VLLRYCPPVASDYVDLCLLPRSRHCMTVTLHDEPTILNYGNSTLVDIHAYLTRRLQSVLNAAARLIFHLRRSNHITDTLSIVSNGCARSRANTVQDRRAVMQLRFSTVVRHSTWGRSLLSPTYSVYMAPGSRTNRLTRQVVPSVRRFVDSFCRSPVCLNPSP